MHLVFVQTSVPCEQLVADVAQWRPLADAVQRERVEVPVVHVLKGTGGTNVTDTSFDDFSCFAAKNGRFKLINFKIIFDTK
jgi:hypothetical protein